MKKQIKSILKKINQLRIERNQKIGERRYYEDISQNAEIHPLSVEQKNEIRNYFQEHLGFDTTTLFHEYYSSLNGIYSCKYLPFRLYYNKIIPALYDLKLINTYDDKNFSEKLFPMVSQPYCYVKNINGHYFSNDNSITYEEALRRCQDIPSAIIKPTLYTSGGEGVKKISIHKGMVGDKTIEDVFKEYGKNFVLQQIVEQHEDLKRLNPTSLQTFRVVTYWRNDEIVLVSALLRIGRKGAFVDNGSAGGYCCGCTSDGKLKKYAYTFHPTTKVAKTDNGIILEDYVLPHFEEVISTAKLLHYEVPHLPLVGWDLTVDKDGKVVLIEINPTFGINILQLTNGPAFGEYTDEILAKVKAFYQR